MATKTFREYKIAVVGGGGERFMWFLPFECAVLRQQTTAVLLLFTHNFARCVCFAFRCWQELFDNSVGSTSVRRRLRSNDCIWRTFVFFSFFHFSLSFLFLLTHDFWLAIRRCSKKQQEDSYRKQCEVDGVVCILGDHFCVCFPHRLQ
jgi:hypothetical protein